MQQQGWNALKVVHVLSVETTAAATLFLTVFYWVGLVSGRVTADNIMKHGANNAVILGDVLLSRVPFASYHFQVRSCSRFRDLVASSGRHHAVSQLRI